MVRVNWTDSAKLDLLEIKEYISLGSKKYAFLELRKIINTTKRLETLPLSGKIISDNYVPFIRQVISGNYKIIFQFFPDLNEVRIIRVIHGAQNTDFDNVVFEPESEYKKQE